MAGNAVKKEDFSGCVLLKVSKEKLRTFDLKHTKTLLEILELLASAKVKSLSHFKEIIQGTRPEAVEKWKEELEGGEAEQQ
jgi:hypothetical protein